MSGPGLRRRLGLAPLFTEAQLATIAAAVAAVETTTAAEIVAAYARRADDYALAPLLWAAFAALLTPLLVQWTPLWLAGEDLLAVQWLVFGLLASVLSLPPVRPRLVPRARQRWCAENLARRQFLASQLHHTRGETGVLIFIAEAERYVEILADRGVSRHVCDADWQAIIDRCITEIRAGRALEGVLACIRECGELLAQHLPATASPNELPDRLVVLK